MQWDSGEVAPALATWPGLWLIHFRFQEEISSNISLDKALYRESHNLQMEGTAVDGRQALKVLGLLAAW